MKVLGLHTYYHLMPNVRRFQTVLIIVLGPPVYKSSRTPSPMEVEVKVTTTMMRGRVQPVQKLHHTAVSRAWIEMRFMVSPL